MRYLYLLLVTLLLASCTSTDGVLPTVASLPTMSSETDSGMPTPTREGDSGSSTDTITGDAGSGFGLGEPLLDGKGFGAEITGAVEMRIRGNGYYGCENGGYALRPSSDGTDQITFLLPADVSAELYRLQPNAGSNASVSASVFLADGATYAGNVNGILILQEVATAPGESIVGSAEFSASNGSGTVTVRAEFDFVAPAETQFC